MTDTLTNTTFKHPRGHLEPCTYCKREMRCDVASDHPLRATKDHYIPRSRRLETETPIIVMACFTCNQIKGDRFPEQWDRFMQRNPFWWEPAAVRVKKRQAQERPKPPPYWQTMRFLKNAEFAKCRPLGKDEPAPIRFSDPAEQAVYEAYARKYWYMLRVPIEEEKAP